MATCELRYPGTTRVLCLLEICCNYVEEPRSTAEAPTADKKLEPVFPTESRDRVADGNVTALKPTTRAIFPGKLAPKMRQLCCHHVRLNTRIVTYSSIQLGGERRA